MILYVYHTQSRRHRASCSAGQRVQQSTPAHGERGSTQQGTTRRRQSSEVAGCRLPCIYWKALTASRANVGHKQLETRQGPVFLAASCRLKAQASQALSSPKRYVCPLLLSHWHRHLMMLVQNQPKACVVIVLSSKIWSSRLSRACVTDINNMTEMASKKCNDKDR